MNDAVNYKQIYRELIPVSAFNACTDLCIHRPDNTLYVMKREDPSAKSVYEALLSVRDPHLAHVVHIEEADDHIDILQDMCPGSRWTRFWRRKAVCRRMKPSGSPPTSVTG